MFRKLSYHLITTLHNLYTQSGAVFNPDTVFETHRFQSPEQDASMTRPSKVVSDQDSCSVIISTQMSRSLGARSIEVLLLKQKVQRLTDQLAEAHGMIEELEMAVEDLNEDKHRYAAEVERWKSTTVAAEEHNVVLEHVTTDRKRELERDLCFSKSEIAKLQLQLHDKPPVNYDFHQHHELVTQLAQMQNESLEIKAQHAHALEAHEDKLVASRHALQKATKDLNHAQQTSELLRDRLRQREIDHQIEQEQALGSVIEHDEGLIRLRGMLVEATQYTEGLIQNGWPRQTASSSQSPNRSPALNRRSLEAELRTLEETNFESSFYYPSPCPTPSPPSAGKLDECRAVMGV